MPVQSLGQEDPREEGMATHSRTVAWRLPWTLEPGRLQPMGSQRDVTVSDTTDMTQHTCKKQKAFSNGLKSESGSVTSSSLRPRGLYSPWNSPGQNTGWGSPSLLQGNLPNPGIERRSLALQADSLPSEPPGKPPFQRHQHSSALAGTEQADHL